MNKTTFAMLSVAATSALPLHTIQAQEIDDGVRLFIGYKSMTFAEQRYSHDTHPDDWFLPNSGIPGSAGTTEVGGRMDFFAFGVGYQTQISNPLSFTFDLGFLVGRDRDEHQNANDPRAPANGSFVYSEINWGMFAAIGVQYNFEYFYIGAGAQLGVAFVESGWNRYGSDDRQSTRLAWAPTGGPTIGCWLTENIAIEGTVQFGRSVDFGIQAIWKY